MGHFVTKQYSLKGYHYRFYIKCVMQNHVGQGCVTLVTLFELASLLSKSPPAILYHTRLPPRTAVHQAAYHPTNHQQ